MICRGPWSGPTVQKRKPIRRESIPLQLVSAEPREKQRIIAMLNLLYSQNLIFKEFLPQWDQDNSLGTLQEVWYEGCARIIGYNKCRVGAVITGAVAGAIDVFIERRKWGKGDVQQFVMDLYKKHEKEIVRVVSRNCRSTLEPGQEAPTSDISTLYLPMGTSILSKIVTSLTGNQALGRVTETLAKLFYSAETSSTKTESGDVIPIVAPLGDMGKAPTVTSAIKHVAFEQFLGKPPIIIPAPFVDDDEDNEGGTIPDIDFSSDPIPQDPPNEVRRVAEAAVVDIDFGDNVSWKGGPVFVCNGQPTVFESDNEEVPEIIFDDYQEAAPSQGISAPSKGISAPTPLQEGFMPPSAEECQSRLSISNMETQDFLVIISLATTEAVFMRKIEEYNRDAFDRRRIETEEAADVVFITEYRQRIFLWNSANKERLLILTKCIDTGLDIRSKYAAMESAERKIIFKHEDLQGDYLSDRINISNDRYSSRKTMLQAYKRGKATAILEEGLRRGRDAIFAEWVRERLEIEETEARAKIESRESGWFAYRCNLCISERDAIVAMAPSVEP